MSNVAQDRTVASCMANGSTNIPLRRSLSKSNNGLPPQGNPNKWKLKYEEAEQKRKLLLSQNEKSKFLY